MFGCSSTECKLFSHENDGEAARVMDMTQSFSEGKFTLLSLPEKLFFQEN
jgi:hypothetical protein